MPITPVTLPLPGTLGNDVASGADGVLTGSMVPTALGSFLLASSILPGLCITDDGGLYVDDTTDFQDADANDVAPLPAAPAVDDAVYFGHGSTQFNQLNVTIGTQGAGTWTIQWQYWNGTAWVALSGVTDGTTGFTAAAGARTVTFTQPGDWVRNTVDSVLAYWIRAVVTAFTSITTQPLVTTGSVQTSSGGQLFSDDTTDANNVGVGDCPLLPTNCALNDASYIGHATQKFCKIKVAYSQARAGTLTITPEYWNGSAWVAIPTVDDDTVGFSAAAGTRFIHFVPPSDWIANTAGNGPNGVAGFFIRLRVSAFTSMTTQPLGTQLWVLPLNAGSGVPMNFATVVVKMTAMAKTVSAANNDSVFLLINKTQGTFAAFTWTKTVAVVGAVVSLNVAVNDELLLVQVTEDGTTEFADASMYLAV